MIKKWKIIHFSAFIVPFAFLASCSKMGTTVPTVTDTTNALGLTIPNGFNYETVSGTTLDISLLTNENTALPGVMVKILDKAAEEGGTVLHTAITDEKGKISGTIKLPAYLKTVIVDPGYIGIMHNATVKIEGKQVYCSLGGTEGYTGNIVPNARIAGLVNQDKFTARTMASPYIYLGKYNSSGKPDYLLPANDKISSELLSYINASLPENLPVPTYHPDYLKDNISTNLKIVEKSDVWITFVHEGAGYQNSLAYFTFPTGKAPTSADKIESLNIILPNASLSGSGGALQSGNKVNIGRFEAGTTIGFCLIANGWSDKNQTVGEGLNKFYSIDALNPESSTSLKRHTVLLKDEENQLILAGFEDQVRGKESDNDFNDIIFYASSNPVTAIETSDINPIDKPGDADKDGVADVYDKFPKDPLRAYINYYPALDKYASIAFEDNWPNTGDYDMNDLVVDYNYKTIQNAKNNTIEMFASYVCRASGASFRNGFGVQFPFEPSVIASAKGSMIADKSIVTLHSNGTEEGQKKAVIIPFDDIYAVMPPQDKNFINTQAGAGYLKPVTINMEITFADALTAAQLGTAPFNPFMITNRTRGKEVHLPGELPTEKANASLFNTMQDNTISFQNRYYLTKNNLPFAVSIPQQFEYPFEGKMITNAYTRFAKWAESGGTSSADWYLDFTGYRTPGSIYK